VFLLLPEASKFEAEDRKFFHKVEKFLPVYTVSNIARQYSSSGPNCHIFVFITPQIIRATLERAHNSRSNYWYCRHY